MIKSYIYALRDTEHDLIGYVGKSIRPQERFIEHMRFVRTSGIFNLPISLNKGDWLTFIHHAGWGPELVVLEELESPTQHGLKTLEYRSEKYWIEQLSSVYSLTNTPHNKPGGIQCQYQAVIEQMANDGCIEIYKDSRGHPYRGIVLARRFQLPTDPAAAGRYLAGRVDHEWLMECVDAFMKATSQ